jgi:hypothetical protein
MLRTGVMGALSALALALSPAALAQDGRPPAMRTGVKTAADYPVWKTIVLGTHRNSIALRDALDAEPARIGDSADEILSRPAFRFVAIKTDVDLVALSVGELGFGQQGATLADIYARAIKLGFELCPAEVGPQLRRQYVDQPVGQFLHIAMDPIATYHGDLIDFTIGNGAEGLLLVGGIGRGDLRLASNVRFVFVRPRSTGGQVAQGPR